MKVVANASPLIALSAINKLGILKELYGKIIISNAVYIEVAKDGFGEPGSYETQVAIDEGWIEKVEVKDRVAVLALLDSLEIGEAESIILAKEQRADIILLDDPRSRNRAQLMGLKIKGVIGILQLARDRGMPIDLKEELDNLRATGFRIGEELYQRVTQGIIDMEET